MDIPYCTAPQAAFEATTSLRDVALKTYEENFVAVIEPHISENFINTTVFGDQRVPTKNEDGEQQSVQHFRKFIHITRKPYMHRCIGHVLPL